VELRAALDEVVKRSDLVLGEEVESFEREFADYCGVRHAVGVSSGTRALTLALIAAGIGPGDEVVVPAHAPITSALGIVHAGATPVLCDVRADTGLIDIASAIEVVGERTVAVIAVHLYGQVCEMDEVRALAQRRGLLVVEDAAEAPGARFEDGRAGSFGDVAAFSFHPRRNLGSLGDGGAVCTDDEAIAARVRRLRDLGRRRDGEHVEIGFEARLHDPQAAVLRVKLRHLDAKNAARRAWAAMYATVLPPTATTLWEHPRGECVYHLYPIRVSGRDLVLERLREQEIYAGVHYAPALHEQPPLAGHRLAHGGVGATEEWVAEELSLPMFPELTVEEVHRVAEAVAQAVD
jgi:dTDP-3-amino-3,4,6-trideoxy-alpha-D-glucose transaminase